MPPMGVLPPWAAGMKMPAEDMTWFTFSFSPITDESGRVGGLFHPVTEMTSSGNRGP